MPVDEASTAARLPPARAHSLLAFWGGSHARFALPSSGTLVIGRGRNADIRLEDGSVSRQHAVVHLDPPIGIEDLGSANGTRVEGRALAPHERAPLPIGVPVEIGEVRLLACARPLPPSESDDTMARVRDIVERVAPSDLPVIITGETGAGKEVLAERIHQRSPRSRGPLLRINCAALPDNLLESELFGHEKGAFTGAELARPGLLETANGGTVLLDEIGEMSPATQAKLLRVLENREVLRVGGRRPTPIDVRFLVATHEDLDVLVVLGRFRQDLLFRLNGITVRVPALRERPLEILPFARDFVAAASTRTKRPEVTLSEDAMLLLQSYRWPGNVRELRQVLERAVLMCSGNTLLAEHMTFGSGAASPAPTAGARPSERPAPSMASPPGDSERQRIEVALESTGGNQTEAAKLLGISRRTLGARLDDLGIVRPRKGARKSAT